VSSDSQARNTDESDPLDHRTTRDRPPGDEVKLPRAEPDKENGSKIEVVLFRVTLRRGNIR